MISRQTGKSRSAGWSVHVALSAALIALATTVIAAKPGESACADDPGFKLAPSAPVVSELFPQFKPGVLAKARMVDLEQGILLRAPGITVRQDEIEGIIADAPENKREELRANSSVILQHLASKKLMTREARLAGFEGDDYSILRAFTAKMTESASVSDQEIEDFYKSNPGAVGNLPFGRVKFGISERLLKNKRQELIAAHEAELAERVPVGVSAAWVKALPKPEPDNSGAKDRLKDRKMTAEQIREYLQKQDDLIQTAK